MAQIIPIYSLKPILVTYLKVTAAIPCLNTQKSIGDIVSRAIKYVDEVIVIDDGSSDATGAIAAAAGAKVIFHQKNYGKGAAMKTAVENTDADIIVFIDGDGQHDPEYIPELVEPIFHGEADYVIGSRYLADSKLSANPLSRRVSNTVASFIISFIISLMLPVTFFIRRRHLQSKSGKIPIQSKKQSQQSRPDYRLLNSKFKRITDCTSGFTAIKKRNWDKLNLISNGFQVETEMIFEQARNGFTIAEIPISCTWEDSLSKLSIIRDGLGTLLLLTKKLILNFKNSNVSGNVSPYSNRSCQRRDI